MVSYVSLSNCCIHCGSIGLRNCLGQTLDFYGEDADDLADDLHAAIRRASEIDSDDEMLEVGDQQSSFWPLVAEVEYRTDADILRGGIVLVDLPGVQDSNAARDQIALKYLGHLDHIFVVAGAVRASDSNPFAGWCRSDDARVSRLTYECRQSCSRYQASIK